MRERNTLMQLQRAGQRETLIGGGPNLLSVPAYGIIRTCCFLGCLKPARDDSVEPLRMVQSQLYGLEALHIREQ